MKSRLTTLILAFALLAAIPAAAQTIPAGVDRWVTPGNLQTYFDFPKGDVESLCGAAPTGAIYRVNFIGQPASGSDWDTAIARLDTVTFPVGGNTVTTRIQATSLRFKGLNAVETPCGLLTFTAELNGPQPISSMTLTRTSTKGGYFHANILVRVLVRAYNTAGSQIGALVYSRTLPNPSTGTPWSFGPTGGFRPGIDTSDNCIAQLRQKLAGTDPASSHYYYIENLIAQGKCTRTN